MDFDMAAILKRIENDPASMESVKMQKKLLDDQEAADAEFLASLDSDDTSK